MMSKLLVAFPGPAVKRIVWRRPDVVLFDETGFWVVEALGRDRRRVDVFDFEPDLDSSIDAPRLVEAIKYWSPIWARWVAHADQYELLYREALLYILRLKTALRQFGVSVAVFHTSASHHLDSALFELGCAEANVPQLFLYNGGIAGRLQPLWQFRSIEDRQRCDVVVSDYRAADDITKYRDGAKAGRPPATNWGRGRFETSYFCGMVDAAYIDARRRAGGFVRRFLARSQPRTKTAEFLEHFRPLGFRDFVRLLRTQRKAVRYFGSRMRTERLSEMLGRATSPMLLLAAHYQPEATSFPEGGRLQNHVDLLIEIRRMGYRKPVLYKEHPLMGHYYGQIIHQTRIGMSRSVSYYEALEALGCVFLNTGEPVPTDVTSNERFVPTTLTGSIALERALLGLPTIVCGHPPFKGLPGTVDLATALESDGLGRSTVGTADEVADAAFDFMDRALSGRTLLNAPGIGSGRPLNDPDSVARFEQEFGRLLERLVDEANRIVTPAQAAATEAPLHHVR